MNVPLWSMNLDVFGTCLLNYGIFFIYYNVSPNSTTHKIDRFYKRVGELLHADIKVAHSGYGLLFL